MVKSKTDKYSASEQGLGYIYQGRQALFHLMKLPEDTIVFLEKDDDLDFDDTDGSKSLISLKHKKAGDKLTDLATDFWKSVNIWLDRYEHDGFEESNLRFFLVTTSEVSTDSFLLHFLPAEYATTSEDQSLVELVNATLAKSKSETIIPISKKFGNLTEPQQIDFLERIVIFAKSPRIDDIPTIIKDTLLRSIRREHRAPVYERLEGWWSDAVIQQLTGSRTEGLCGYEVSDKLSQIADEYKEDNLPITFRDIEPSTEIDTENDPRLFVAQLREIGLSARAIRIAIIDYYRAFQQRSAWARENLLISNELEQYENRITDEWDRYKDVVFDELEDDTAEQALKKAGKELYNWAQFQTVNFESLRIRARVTEPYVLRGSFHILAGMKPEPRVYWHPKFLDRLDTILGSS